MIVRRIMVRVGFLLLLAGFLVYAIFPFYYALVSSLQGGSELFSPTYLPSAPDIDNYVAVFREQPFGRSILNSFIVAVGTVGVTLMLAALAAYALGRIRFRGRQGVLLATLAISMFPQVAVLSGMFELIRTLGLYDALPGLMLSYLILTLPFSIWVLTAFMREVPGEIEEAALLDGASRWTILTRILLPLVAPALVTTGLLALIIAWNEFLFALTFTLSAETRTVPVAIALISGATQHELPWGIIMAASIIVTIPLAAIVLLFQGRIVSGLTSGAIKG
ncbi:MAG TPA: carbohydrate ABC transporter permease [Alphaproteobacteria bacterium]|nr:carbohydrate ABC transporter permease [Alphaproteobacteria bacterium]